MHLGYIHYFRAIAIVFIVAGHSIDAFTWNENPELGKIVRILISNGSTLFVFIAGYLFQHLLVKYETKRYFISKLKNVIIPYILISIPAIFVFVFLQERETVWAGFYQNPEWIQVLLFYATGMHLAPLWFVPMIFFFYLIAPILSRFDDSKYLYYLLPLAILLSCLVDRGLPHQSFIHFFSAYLLGMFCSRYKNEVNNRLKQNTFILANLILITVFSIYEFYLDIGTMSYLNHLQKLAMSLFFLGLLFKYNSHLNSKFVSTIADVSFGVFFIHSYVLTSTKIVYTKAFGELPEGGLISYFTMAIVFTLASVFLILLIKKIAGKRSRLLIGS